MVDELANNIYILEPVFSWKEAHSRRRNLNPGVEQCGDNLKV
jgi:hypothetical protein